MFRLPSSRRALPVDESAGLPTLPSERVLHLTPEDINLGLLATVTKALGSDRRLAILDLLGANTCSVLEIAEALDLPQSTATQHINILENAGLIKTDLQPAK